MISEERVYMIEKESQREEREIARKYRTLYCCKEARRDEH